MNCVFYEIGAKKENKKKQNKNIDGTLKKQ